MIQPQCRERNKAAIGFMNLRFFDLLVKIDAEVAKEETALEKLYGAVLAQ